MSVPFPPPQFAPLTPILIAVTIQAPALLLLFGFESGLFLRLPKLFRFVAHVSFVVLSFLFILALLFELMYGRIALPARVALYAWMIFGIAAMSWSFFRGWISKDSVTGLTITATTIGCIFLALTSHGGAYMEVARRTQCRNNLKQFGIALIDHADKKGRFPKAVEREKGGPATSWRVTFLSAAYMPQPAPYDRSQSWEAPANRAEAISEIPLYSCPSNWIPHDEQDRWLTSYVLVTGPGTIIPGEKPLTFQEISDGTSSTLLGVEAAGLQIVWTEPRDADVSRDPIGINLPGDRVGRSPGLVSSYHPGGALAMMADGSVRRLSEYIHPNVLRALTTANGRDSTEGAFPD